MSKSTLNLHLGMTAKTTRYLNNSIKETLAVTDHKQFNSDGPDHLIFRYNPEFFTDLNPDSNDERFIGLSAEQIANSSVQTTITIQQNDGKVIARMATKDLPMSHVPNGNPFLTEIASLSKTAHHADLIWDIPLDLSRVLLACRRNVADSIKKTNTSMDYNPILKAIIRNEWFIDGDPCTTVFTRNLGDTGGAGTGPVPDGLFSYVPRHFSLDGKSVTVDHSHYLEREIKMSPDLTWKMRIEPNTPFLWSVSSSYLNWRTENEALIYTNAQRVYMTYHAQLHVMAVGEVLFPTQTQIQTLIGETDQDTVETVYNQYLRDNIERPHYQQPTQIWPLYATTKLK